MKSKFFNRHSKILVFVAGIALLFAVVLFVIMQNGVSAKEAELVNLKAALQELQEENSELDYLINDADEAELFEHLARDRGYVYPDEKIYYNVTPGN
jgi:cell division protein FtsB